MKTKLVLHPLFFALYPVLFLLSHNIELLTVSEAALPTALTVLSALFFWSILALILKDARKAGLVVSLFFVLFFSYGHVHNAIKDIAIAGFRVGKESYLLSAWGVLLTLGVYFSVRTQRDLNGLTRLLNKASAVLVAISVLVTGYELITREGSVQHTGMYIEAVADTNEGSKLPDIFYIMVDGYGREDVLKELYGHDNGDFIDYLERKGFYVAKNATSNYNQTLLSLSATLNASYLDSFVKKVGRGSRNRFLLKMTWFDQNAISSFLKKRGYLTVSFSSGGFISKMANVDVNIKTEGDLSEFQSLLINTTPLPLVLKMFEGWLNLDFHRKRVLYILDHLHEPAEYEPPVFVFAHIVSPHPPFVFDKDGGKVEPYGKFSFNDGNHFMNYYKVSREFYVERYRDQLVYLNKKLKQTMDKLLSGSDDPPIIILQGDHGPGSMLNHENLRLTNVKERFGILSAFYLPGMDYKEHLYDNISSVNTFRLVLDHYLGTKNGLLKDKSYFAPWNQPFRHTRIPDELLNPQ